MARTIIKPGETYGKIKVLEVDSPKSEHRAKTYLCKCLSCGRNFVTWGQDILKNQDIGCIPCRSVARNRKREDDARSHIGNVYNNLKIVEFDGLKRTEGRKYGDYLHPWVKCECQKCGEISSIPLNRVKSDGARQCEKCSDEENLERGRQISRAESVEGTKISAIDGRRKTNKNSSTGHTGVSYHDSAGKYRAYIYFKRKQYYLGLYDTLEGAVAARKAAEKRVYGDFLKWYQTEYPEQWKKIKHREQSSK